MEIETQTENGRTANFDKFMEDLRAVVRDGQELLKAGVGTVKERAVAGAQSTDQLVRSRPYQSLGVVFGVGVLVGVLAAGMLSRGSAAEEE